MNRLILRTAVAAIIVTALVSHAAQAQLPIPSLSVVGGVSHYNLSGSGTAPIGELRVDVPLFVAVAEGSVGIFRPNENGARHTYVIPEAQLQWQLLPLLVKPYIGVGGGWFHAVDGPIPQRSDVTLSASAGVRVGIPLTGIGARAEVRFRTIGSSSNNATEFTLGLSW